MKELDEQRRLYFPPDKRGRIQPKSYLDEIERGKPAPDLWTDMMAIQAQSKEREDYPTQKPEALLDRITLASSNPGDLVLDCFLGSGTTTAVAQKLGRRWIGCDINKGAIQTTAKRMQTIIREQVETVEKAKAGDSQTSYIELNDLDKDKTPEPAQLAFTVWRVNDYDLAIQHNEAVNLACEHIGIQRTRISTARSGNHLLRLSPLATL